MNIRLELTRPEIKKKKDNLLQGQEHPRRRQGLSGYSIKIGMEKYTGTVKKM